MRLKYKKYKRYFGGLIKTYLPDEIKSLNKGNEFSLVLSSAHKVGSTWSYRMICDLNLFREWIIPKQFRSNINNKGLIDLHSSNVDHYLANMGHYRLFKSHSTPPEWSAGDKVKFLTVFRDPRDVIISNIFYLSNLDKALGGWPELKEMTDSERILHYMKKGVFDLELMEKWLSHSNSCKIYYEDMLADPVKVMRTVFFELKLNVPEEKLNHIVDKNTFKKQSEGRNAGQSDAKSFFRKGIAGDWRNYFDDDMVDAFKNSINGRWNRLLVDLGYESGLDW